MKLASPFPAKKPRIELIPLIDVMFFLLASFIFVSLSMVVHRGVRVDVPPSSTAETAREDYFAITLTAEGALYANKKHVSQAELSDALQRLVRDAHTPRVYLAADRKVPHGEVMAVLDLVRAQGISRIAFETTLPRTDP